MRDSDGTVVFTAEAKATGGSVKTIQFAKKHGKPWLHIGVGDGYEDPAVRLRQFVEEEKIAVLKVAGSRASKAPDIHRWVMGVLEGEFFWSENHPSMIGGAGEG